MSNVKMIYPDFTAAEKLVKQREDKVEMSRDMFKLSTAAYVDAARVNPGLAMAAKGMLQRAAIDYVETLVGRKLIDRNSELTWRRNETDPFVIAQSQQLELMALASESAQTHVGKNYNAQTRQYFLSVAMLYQTAIRYVEALAGRIDGDRPNFDRAHALEGEVRNSDASDGGGSGGSGSGGSVGAPTSKHKKYLENPAVASKAKKWVK